jgi:hypothetical protein
MHPAFAYTAIIGVWVGILTFALVLMCAFDCGMSNSRSHPGAAVAFSALPVRYW